MHVDLLHFVDVDIAGKESGDVETKAAAATAAIETKAAGRNCLKKSIIFVEKSFLA